MNRSILLLLPLLLVVAVPLAAQPYAQRSIPMRDGRSLAADLYSTDTTAQRPTILIQTPYNKNLYRISSSLPGEAGGVGFPRDSANYNYVIVDWRGFFGSAGAAVTGYDRGLDGYDVVEWIAAQPWSDGKVGTWGPSALGAIQYMTARKQPPHLVCSVPLVMDFQSNYSDYYYGGVYRREHVESVAGLGLAPAGLILQHPTRDLVWTLAENSSGNVDSFAVPMLLIGGWFDHFPDDVMRAFADLRAGSDPTVREKHRLIMGPWLHSGIDKAEQGELTFPNATGVAENFALQFFDRYLRGLDNSFERQPAMRYYQMGANEWRTTENWSGPGTKHDTLHLHAGGILWSEPAMAGGGPPSSFRYDPRDPTPAYGGSRFSPFDRSMKIGPVDLRTEVENRSDVLTFSSPVFDRNLELGGPVAVDLWVSSDRTDTDFGIRLTDVYPDGRSMILTQGIRRMRFRNGFRPADTAAMTPREIYPVRIELQNLAHTFLPGHRLRIDVSSAIHPHFDLNPNSGGPLYQPGDTLIANNTIYHDPTYPSRVILTTRGVSSSVADDAAEKNRSMTIAPNPGRDRATVTLTIPHRTHATVTLVDLLGRTVTTVAHGTLDPGAHDFELDLRGVSPGLYLCRVQGSGLVDQRVMVVR